MAYTPPSAGGPPPGLSPLARTIIKRILIVLAIPVVAFLFFMAAVFIIYFIHGPIRWN